MHSKLQAFCRVYELFPLCEENRAVIAFKRSAEVDIDSSPEVQLNGQIAQQTPRAYKVPDQKIVIGVYSPVCDDRGSVDSYR